MTGLGIPSAAADPCPDIEVIFASGYGRCYPASAGVGEAFVNSLRAKVGGQSVDTYAVNYPAGIDFDTSAPAGAADATDRVQWMADNCPDTKLVLGGMSQGAGVIDLITADPRPMGPGVTPTPMPPPHRRSRRRSGRLRESVARTWRRRTAAAGEWPYGSEDDRHVCPRRHLLLPGLKRAGTLRVRGERHDRPGREVGRGPSPVTPHRRTRSKQVRVYRMRLRVTPAQPNGRCTPSRSGVAIMRSCRESRAWSCRGATYAELISKPLGHELWGAEGASVAGTKNNRRAKWIAAVAAAATPSWCSPRSDRRRPRLPNSSFFLRRPGC